MNLENLTINDTSITQAGAAVNDAFTLNDGALALPNSYAVHDLEKWLETRRHMRGTMQTSSEDHFAKYVKANRETGAAIFIDTAAMTATAVLNLGNPEAPGHCDNLAVLACQRLAEYLAMLKHAIPQQDLTQRALAEFLEDWDHCITFHHDQQELPKVETIYAIRHMTIKAARDVEQVQESLSATRSAFESVQATAKTPLPTSILFRAHPYKGFKPRDFYMRLAIISPAQDKDPIRFHLHLVKLEEHQEQMGEELVTKLAGLFGDDVPVHIGTYR